MTSENIAPQCWSSPTADSSKHTLGPRRQGLHELQRNCLPDSPDDRLEKYELRSDDFIQTSEMDEPIEEREHESMSERPLVIVGRRDQPVTLGRGGASTVKIGKRNRQISRVHVSIAFNTCHARFELTVLGLNGARVDHLSYAQHETAPLEDGSFIDVLGDHVVFHCPPEPLNFDTFESKRTLYVNDHTESKNDALPLALDVNENKSPAAPAADHEDTAVPQTEQDDNAEDKSGDVKEEECTSATEPKEEKVTVETVLEKAHEDKPDTPSDPAEQTGAESPTQETLSLTPSSTPLKEEEEGEHDYAEVIIDALVFSRKSSMPISDICSRVLKTNPAIKSQPRQVWEERIGAVLKDRVFFGEIVRKGKTADGSPKENLYYYNPDKDTVEWRRSAYTQVGRSARKCTLQDKQYFWRIPPKLGRHRNTYIPPPAKDPSDPTALLKRSRPKKEDEPVKKPKV